MCGMVLFPRNGCAYWFVTDYWERFYAVPVTVCKNELVWTIAENEFVEYPINRRWLYNTQYRAKRVAARLNKRVTA
jgi:hypothetical protein